MSPLAISRARVPSGWGSAIEVGAVILGLGFVSLELFAPPELGEGSRVDQIGTFAFTHLHPVPVLVTALVWVLIGCFLLGTRRGRKYLAFHPPRRFVSISLQESPHNLTIAGLVLAALALGPVSGNRLAQTYLASSLTAFLIAWTAGTFPGRTASAFVRDAAHWFGLALLLVGTEALIDDQLPGSARLVMLGGLTILAIYSSFVARSYYVTSNQLARREESTTKRQRTTGRRPTQLELEATPPDE